MLEKITRRTRREFIKKGVLYFSGSTILFACGKKGPTEPDKPPPPLKLSAKFTASPTEGWSPLKVYFNASSSTGNIIEYLWNFGDNKTGTGKIIDHAYAIYGKYTTELMVKDAKSTDKTTIDIIVNELIPNPKPSEYFGKVNNGSVADNLAVKAEINGVKCYSGLTKKGYYNIIVPADNPGTVNIIEGGKTGDKIQVKIDNKNASPLLDFKSGSIDLVDLTY